MTDVTTIVSNSRKVRGYVKAVLASRKAEARLAKMEPRYKKLQSAALIAADGVRTKRAKLNGTQYAAAERLLASPAIECMAKPCKEVAQ